MSWLGFWGCILVIRSKTCSSPALSPYSRQKRVSYVFIYILSKHEKLTVYQLTETKDCCCSGVLIAAVIFQAKHSPSHFFVFSHCKCAVTHCYVSINWSVHKRLWLAPKFFNSPVCLLSNQTEARRQVGRSQCTVWETAGYRQSMLMSICSQLCSALVSPGHSAAIQS